MLHPFVVHFGVSLPVLAAAAEILPILRRTIPERGRSLLWRATVPVLLLAVLTGWRTLHLLETTSPSLPALAYLHRLAAISATGLFLILWFTRDKIFVTLAGTVLSLAGILLILAAAGLGGHLVYHDRLGTLYRTGSEISSHQPVP